jgi:ribosome biogenesis protein BMS1
VLCDRIEDLTDPEVVRRERDSEQGSTRKVALFGWVRGSGLREKGAPVHIAGVGDFILDNVKALDDPCPLPVYQKAKRSLNEREQRVYAPFSGLGGLLYDNDAVYIETRGAQAFAREDKKVGGSANNAMNGLNCKLNTSYYRSIPVRTRIWGC